MSDLDITAPPSHLRDADGEPVPLDVHLADVANRVRATSSDTPTTPNGSSIADLTTRLAWIHDIGKLTSWFQKHLHRPDDAPPVEGPSHHAPLGALVAYYVLDTAGFGGDDPLIGFIAVAKHHGRLPNTTEYIKKITADPDTGTLHQLFRKDTLRQAEDISENEPGVANALIEEATDGVGSWEGFCEWIEDIRRTGRIDDLASHALNKMTLLPEPDRLDTGFYSGCLQVWSNLVLADKTSARHLTQETDLPTSVYESPTPRRTAIDAAVRSLQHDAEHSDIGERTQTLNQKREQARQEARTQAEALDTAEQSLVTLTLPHPL